MLFKVFLIFSSGGHFVQQSGTILAIVKIRSGCGILIYSAGQGLKMSDQNAKLNKVSGLWNIGQGQI